MILVLGATGTNGGEVAHRLAAAGVRVRALVRNPDKAANLPQENIELVAGDLDEPASLDRALSGVDRAFFVAAVDQRYAGWFRNFLAAARRSGSPHIVRFSAMGAVADSPSELMRQHGETDQALADSGLPYTILQPNAFYQNLFWSAKSIKDQGDFYLPLGDARQSLVDVRDIAAVAVEVLTDSGHDGKTYVITGPESLSYHDVAAKLSAVLGRPIRYVDVPPETARDSMEKAGMPAWNARAVAELYRLFAAGKTASVTDTIQRVTGRSPISFEQFARDHATVFG
jgi:uncharacterized protein YbjT (DUF2867 family)